MFKVKLTSLLCLMIAYGACVTAELTPNNPTAKKAPTSQTVPPDTVITLERMQCDGYCPVYKLTIFADGTVIFEGDRFVKTPGVVKSSISQEKLKELVSAFEEANYFSLNDNYTPAAGDCPEVATDLPSAITSIKIDGKLKSVDHYHGCTGVEALQELTALEDKIDEVVNTRQWIEQERDRNES